MAVLPKSGLRELICNQSSKDIGGSNPSNGSINIKFPKNKMNKNTIYYIRNDDIDSICCYSGDISIGYTIHELYNNDSELGNEYLKLNKAPYRFSTEIDLFNYIKKYIFHLIEKKIEFNVYDGNNNLIYNKCFDYRISLLYDILNDIEKQYNTVLDLLKQIDKAEINYYRLKNLCDILNKLNTKILLDTES
jgi:hypothetical protein